MRTPSMDKNGMKKGAWSPEEDQKLIEYIKRYRIWNWTLMPKFAGLSRTGKSCRLRWVNYLNPQTKRGNITKEDEDIILTMYTKLGKRWSAIARKLPGRTDNEIKNYWHTHLKKHFKETQVSKGTDVCYNVVEDNDESTIESKRMSELDSAFEGSNVESSINISSDSYLFSSECFPSISTSSYEVNDINVFDEMSGNGDLYRIWSQSLTNENMGMSNEESNIQGWYDEPSSPYSLYNGDYVFGQLLGGDTDGTWNLSI